MSVHTRRDERGATVVEFALLTIPFLLLIIGFIQFGFYFWTAETANSAAREAARRIVVGDCWNQSDLDAFVSSHSPTMQSATYDIVETGLNGAPQTGDKVLVTVVANGETMGFWPLPGGGEVTREYEAHMEVTEASGPGEDACTP